MGRPVLHNLGDGQASGHVHGNIHAPERAIFTEPDLDISLGSPSDVCPGTARLIPRDDPACVPTACAVGVSAQCAAASTRRRV